MKPKRIVKNPDPDNAPFVLLSEVVTPLPPKKKPINRAELLKLERTRTFGGLVPERSAFLDRLCRLLGEKKPADIGYSDKDIVP